MSLPRRLALLEWARATGAMIFEDDYDSEYRYSGRPVPALQGLDRQGGRSQVLFAGSFSKVLFPALRIGYLAVGPAQVLVTFGARSLLYSVQKGLHAAYLPVAGASAATVVIQQVSGSIPCIGDAAAGVLLPSAAGPAVPPVTVSG